MALDMSMYSSIIQDAHTCSMSVNTAVYQEKIKGEDVVLCLPPDQNDKCPVGIYAVFDGHAGVQAARFCRSNIVAELRRRLPQMACPPLDSPLFQSFAEHLQMAITSTFVALEMGALQCHTSANACRE